MIPNRWWQIGTLLPAMMLLLFLGDIVMRFMPVNLWAFRAWEAVWRDSDGGLGPFTPNYVVVVHHTYGDLAALGNLASPRDYHEEDFRVDRFGYRNSFPADQPQPFGLLVGDSFTVVPMVPQNLTLTEQLTSLGNVRFYNAGGRNLQTPGSVHEIATRLDMTSGVVIYELLERSARVAPPPIAVLIDSPSELNSSGTDASTQVQDGPSWFDAHPLANTISRKIRRFREDPWSFQDWYDSHSPMKIISHKIVKNIENDVLQPNIYRDKVVRGTLKNNDEMLFFPGDFGTVDNVETQASAWTSYLAAFSDRLAEQNLKMIVLLIPNKGTVYGSLTKELQPTNGEQLLADLQQKLQDTGICTVDLTPLYRRYAEEGLSQKQYLYWRDDSHWNSRGIGIAAQQLLPCIETAQTSAPVGKNPSNVGAHRRRNSNPSCRNRRERTTANQVIECQPRRRPTHAPLTPSPALYTRASAPQHSSQINSSQFNSFVSRLGRSSGFQPTIAGQPATRTHDHGGLKRNTIVRLQRSGVA